MSPEERAAYDSAIQVGYKLAKQHKRQLTHVLRRDDGTMEFGFTAMVPKEGLELIASRAEWPEGFEPRHKRAAKRGSVQVELPL